MNPAVEYEDQQQITHILHRYCEAMDGADFDGFAALFERGRWFAAESAGSKAVRDWIDEHIVVHDGKTHTRHELTNLTILPTDSADRATFHCYVAIWQDLPGHPATLLVHARFDGSFERADDEWWWSTHTTDIGYAGDLSGHIRDAFV